MWRRLVYAGAGAVALWITGPAGAQELSVPFKQKAPPPTKEQIERQKAADKAYEATIQNMPDKKQSTDPWGGIRSGSPAAAKKSDQ
jgi:hypothetical protein